jgi:hypothetical protein
VAVLVSVLNCSGWALSPELILLFFGSVFICLICSQAAPSGLSSFAKKRAKQGSSVGVVFRGHRERPLRKRRRQGRESKDGKPGKRT